jgi:hypothetical protein
MRSANDPGNFGPTPGTICRNNSIYYGRTGSPGGSNIGVGINFDVNAAATDSTNDILVSFIRNAFYTSGQTVNDPGLPAASYEDSVLFRIGGSSASGVVMNGRSYNNRVNVVHTNPNFIDPANGNLNTTSSNVTGRDAGAYGTGGLT